MADHYPAVNVSNSGIWELPHSLFWPHKWFLDQHEKRTIRWYCIALLEVRPIAVIMFSYIRFFNKAYGIIYSQKTCKFQMC